MRKIVAVLRETFRGCVTGQIPRLRFSVRPGIISDLNRYVPDDGCAMARPILSTTVQTIMSDFIETNTNDDGIDRRGFLKCMAWAGTDVIWSINGGLLTSTVLVDSTLG